VLKALGRAFIRWTRPFVVRLAHAYDIRVEQGLRAQGQHPLRFGDGVDAWKCIPKSAYFNTRSGSITIGRNTVFGENVSVLTGKHMHRFEAEAAGVPHHHVPSEGRDITIGDGCYVGTGAIIIGPVSIGDYAVIGAGAVVTHDIPERAFAAGVPARVVKMLQPEAAPVAAAIE
jgi:acetyltransferase-like isoleucine patch superfamily enzyme